MTEHNLLYDFVLIHLGLVGELTGALIVLGMAIIICGVMISVFDGISLEDALYLAIITALTVGFGDVLPKSRASRVVSVILAAIGVVLVGLVVGITAQSLDMALEQQGR